MKVFLQVLLVFVIGPALGIAITYAACAFIAWDWWWAATAAGDARFVFLVFAGFAAALGFAGGGAVACSLD